MRFSVNISLLFTEVPFLERFAAAARSGFSAVEFCWPPAEALPHLEEAVRDTNLERMAFAKAAAPLRAINRSFTATARPELFGEATNHRSWRI